MLQINQRVRHCPPMVDFQQAARVIDLEEEVEDLKKTLDKRNATISKLKLDKTSYQKKLQEAKREKKVMENLYNNKQKVVDDQLASAQEFAKASGKESSALSKAHAEQLLQIKKELNEQGHRTACEMKLRTSAEKKLAEANIKKGDSEDKLKAKILELKIATSRIDKAEKALKAAQKVIAKEKSEKDEIALKRLQYQQQNLKIKLKNKVVDLEKVVEMKDKKLESITSEHQSKLQQIRTKHALMEACKDSTEQRKKE